MNTINRYDLGLEYVKITLLGTGTSQGVPVIGCKCDVCTSGDDRDNRLRTSILIEVRDVSIVVDTGPDFRVQMLREDVCSLDAIVYTHEHKDHLAGMDDVRAFNQIHNRAMEVWANKDVEKALRRDFFYAFGDTKEGGLPQVNINSLGSKEESNGFIIKGVEWTLLPVKHYNMDVYGFRVVWCKISNRSWKTCV